MMSAAAKIGVKSGSSSLSGFWKKVRKQKFLILMILPAFLIVLIFNYFPMYGILMAFEDYKVAYGVWGSEWVGLEHFQTFFSNPLAVRTIKNTVLLGLYNFLWSFPAPILLALLINEINSRRFKKVVQTISYLPYFLSTVIIVGMLKDFCSINGGLFNQIITALGGEPINFFSESGWFRTLFIGSGIWQGIGWGTIIYLAALAGVDVALYEAATIDGANRFQKIIHITLPAIMPTVTILMIMNVGGILGSDFQKVMLMYSPKIYDVADVIGTYTYREGIEGAKYSYTTAVGLFTSVLSFILLAITNFICKKFSDNSLW